MSQYTLPTDVASQYPLGIWVKAEKRPLCVKILGRIGVALGVVAILGSIRPVLPYISSTPDPLIDRIREDSTLYAISMSLAFFQLFLAVLLGGSAIGTLSLRPLGRRALVLWAAIDIPLRIIAMAIAVLWLQPLMVEVMRNDAAMNGLRDPDMVEKAARMGIGVGVGISILCLSYPLCVLFFLTQPSVRAAFGEWVEEESSAPSADTAPSSDSQTPEA